MSTTDRLADHADDIAEAAETAASQAEHDACRVLEAVARGEPVPQDVARRVLDRAGVDR